MAFLLRGYMRLLERHPIKTQAITTGVLMCTGDFLAQTLVEKKPLSQYDFKRGGKFLLFGTIVAGPALRTWYVALDKIVKHPKPAIAVMQKIALDQLFFAPTFITVFVSTMTFWETKSKQAVLEKLKADYVTILLANYKLWPAAQVINFYLVPLNLRVMYANVVAVVWNTYLAYMQNRVIQTPSDPTDA